MHVSAQLSPFAWIGHGRPGLSRVAKEATHGFHALPIHLTLQALADQVPVSILQHLEHLTHRSPLL
jgi:hypothetical protein